MSQIIVCSKLKRKLYLVYLLNVIDWVCTVLLLSTGLFYEANPIARTFIGSLSLGFLIKCILPFVIIFFAVRSMHILDFSQLKIADMLICFALTVYIAITLDHFINFIILIIA
ncbi:MAG: hypothetical protein IJD68_04865 [Ruminococcus sp.]|nr:hypothetical protein [Ruminococcus sp.]